MREKNNDFRKIIINCNSYIKDALIFLEKNKKRFLICVDDSKKVVGTITDGDIRRILLNDFDLNSVLINICNKNFKYLTLNSTFEDICELFKDEKIDFLPIVNEKKQLINIITKKQFHIILLEDIKFNLNFDFSELDKIKLEHEIYNRPWGFYKSTFLTSHAQSKIITVFPKGELSLQEHKKREEHWIIIKGKGKVILGESKLDVYAGKYIYIPKGCKHQILNTSKEENLIFAEIQLGEYFGEDDIIRYSDKYGRVKNIKESKK